MTRHKALLYARISGARDGRETSPAVQIERCYRAALDRARTVDPKTDIYMDADKGSHSAFTRANIPGWNKLESRALSDPEVADVIIDSPDRGWRNTRIMLNFEASIKKLGVKLVFVDSGEVDTDTPTGMLQFTVRGILAEIYSRETSWRIRTKHYEPLRARGKYLGHQAPPGLKRTGSRFDVKLIPGPGLPVIVEFLKLYLQDYGTPGAAKELEKRGLIPAGHWARWRVKLKTILAKIDKGYYDGNIEPSLLAAVKHEHKKRLSESRRTRRPKHSTIPLLWQLLVCAKCGRRYTTSRVHYPYGARSQTNFVHAEPRSPGCIGQISSRKADKQAFAWLDRLSGISPEVLDQAARSLSGPPADGAPDLELRIAKLDQRLKGYELMCADGDITRERYRQIKAEIDSQIKELGKERQADAGVLWTYDGARLFLDELVGANFPELAKSDPERANRLLRSFFARVVVGEKRILTFEPYPEFGMLLEPQAGV